MKKKLLFSISLIWLAGCFAAACAFVAGCGTNFIDSDMSSELVLAKLLSEQGGILAENWFYSTEIKVLNSQIFIAPLFWIFKSWSTVRCVGTAIMLALLIASSVFALRSLSVTWTSALFATGFLLLPLSSDYVYGVIEGIFYIPYVILSLLPIGFFCRAYDAPSGKKRVLLTGICAVIALLSGLSGIRQVFLFYLPAAAASALLLAGEKKIEKGSKSLAYAETVVISCAAGLAGYLLNKTVLSRVYSFCDYGVDTFGRDLLFTEFSLGGLEQFFNQLFAMLGYKTGAMFSGYILYNALFGLIAVCAIAAVICVLRGERFDIKEKNLVLTFLIALALLAVVFCFTDMDKIGRYSIPVVVLLVPVIAVFFGKWETDRRIAALLAAALMGLAAVTSLNTYKVLARSDQNTMLKDVYAYLDSAGYTEGYSSFWSGNVLTELSDGGIDMRVVGTDYILSADDLGNVYHWLQRKSHLDTQPEGKFFLLLTGKEAESCRLGLTEEYSNDRYLVYGFENFRDFEALYK